MESVELLVKLFPAQAGARMGLLSLEKLVKERELRLVSLAAVEKDAQGIASITESQDVSAGQGALWGALVGGVVGLLGGPLGVVVGAAAGAATGGVTAHTLDTGFSQEFLGQVKAALQPGSSLLLLLVEASWTEKALLALESYHGKLLRQVIKDEVIQYISSSHEQDNL